MEFEIPNSQGLVERAQEGDAAAFDEICRLCETPLLRHAMALCGKQSLAEDLAQDTLVEAWKGLRRYNGRCQFFTWLCAIMLNRYRNILRERRPAPFSGLPKTERDQFQHGIEQLPAQDSSPDQNVQDRERAAMVHSCLQALPNKHRQVVYLRFYVDDSLEGIAEALGCSVGTVKSRLFHSMEKLRAMNALKRNK